MPLENPTAKISASATAVPKKTTVKKSFKKASIAASELVSQNSNRIGMTLLNNSEASVLFVDVDRSVYVGDCLVALVPGAYYEFPFDATTAIWGIWDGLDSGVSIREFLQV